ncbi:TKL/RIPK protein kinase [Thecamonas trahens ATCC 50062]|uniref:TKL/RIPK protein kinase n=1 Tax=Thecamonas trahens ATCC 50062 TaxID=461836 RepID=A0A0L0DEI5_THETB|nr:TKL/RIPK protein kinase [Thecamonas trahens ATCC 50062]KNC50742.1 TKL/RIPK protein kinase [Thecamonas trahens ATCC 50062]|eukprot:XP_013756707.1 TKL/RIPK protein kinase [Thecamonas trahens ATCC 50062]
MSSGADGLLGAVVDEACRSGEEQAVREALATGYGCDSAYKGWTPLQRAAAAGHVAITGATALMLASGCGHVNVVRFLVKQTRADVDACNDEGASPCYLAAQNGHLEVVRYLVSDVGVDPLSPLPDGTSTVYIAAQNGHVDVLRFLLGQVPEAAMARRAEGAFPLLVAAFSGKVEVARLLVEEHGADVDECDANGVTPLYVAAQNGHLPMVAYLATDAGAAVEAADVKGITPLYVAAYSGQLSIVRYLVEKAAADVQHGRDSGATPLYIAAQVGHAQVVEYLATTESGGVNAIKSNGETALHTAARYGHLPVVQFLVSPAGGADVDRVRRDGATPFWVAAHAGRVDVVRWLASAAQADVRRPTCDGTTPFAAACARGHVATVACLAVEVLALTPGDFPVDATAYSPTSSGRGMVVDGSGQRLFGVLSRAALELYAGMRLVKRVLLSRVEAVTRDSASILVRCIGGETVALDASSEANAAEWAAALDEATGPGRLDWRLQVADLVLDETKSGVLGRGAFGVVRRGTWHGFPVAVKQLHDAESMGQAARAEFVHEAELMAGLRHPNVVRFIGASLDADSPCLVTELLEGGSLYSLLHTKRSFAVDWPLVVRIASDVAAGMAYLHACEPPVVHRDLKSPNVLLDRSLRAKIADFGLTKAIAETGVHTTAGTARWAAPELLRNEAYGHKVDVYSFGVLLWEMCTRSVPYRELDNNQVIFRALRGGARPTIPDYVPPTLAALMSEAWAEDPTVRPAFVDIVARLDLGAPSVAASSGGPAVPDGVPGTRAPRGMLLSSSSSSDADDDGQADPADESDDDNDSDDEPLLRTVVHFSASNSGASPDQGSSSTAAPRGGFDISVISSWLSFDVASWWAGKS